MDKNVEVKLDGQTDNSGALRTLESVIGGLAGHLRRWTRAHGGKGLEVMSLGFTIPLGDGDVTPGNESPDNG